jgi:neutral ceramidase
MATGKGVSLLKLRGSLALSCVTVTWLTTTLTGCALLKAARMASESLVIPAYRVVEGSGPGTFIVGAASAEITPPPGYATGGHGPAGSLARGHWLRLYARAFYFEDRDGHKLVLVSLDSFALPKSVYAEVARRLGPLGIHREELILAANHTHHGPANYMSATSFNDFGSTYPGFDNRLFRVLVGRVVEAVEQARRDALANKGEPVRLVVHRGRLPPILRNRAPAVFDLNPDRDEIVKAFGNEGEPCKRMVLEPRCDFEDDCEPPGGWAIEKNCPRLRAVDRNVTILDIRRGSTAEGRRVGALVFLAVHPTVLWHDAPLFSSDFTGWAMNALEREWAAPAGVKPVVGFFNGAEGDITARRVKRDIGAVARLGEKLATAIKESIARDGETLPEPVWITARQTDLDATRKPNCRASGISGWGDVRLAKAPTFGAAGPGGGEGDRSPLYSLGWKEGVTTEPKDGQGPKLKAFDSKLLRGIPLTDLIGPPETFPSTLPVSTVSLGNCSKTFSVVAFPAELTTAMGHEIREKLHLEHGKVEIIGLANEYASYVTTAAEYAAQDYAGASTIWGPSEGAFLGCTLSNLLGEKSKLTASVPEVVFRPGLRPISRFGPELCGERRAAVDEELHKILVDASGRPARSLPTFTWTEVLDSKRLDFQAVAGRRVEMRELRDGKWETRTFTPPGNVTKQEDDDRGDNFVTLLVDAADEECCTGPACAICRKPDVVACRQYADLPNKEAHPALRNWAVLWRAPIAQSSESPQSSALSPGPYSFRVHLACPKLEGCPPGKTRVLCSKPFRLDEKQTDIGDCECNALTADGRCGN